MSNTIAATVKGIRTPSDLECFDIFTVEIDGNGNDLWHFRKIRQKKKTARKVRQEMIPEEADFVSKLLPASMQNNLRKNLRNLHFLG